MWRRPDQQRARTRREQRGDNRIMRKITILLLTTGFVWPRDAAPAAVAQSGPHQRRQSRDEARVLRRQVVFTGVSSDRRITFPHQCTSGADRPRQRQDIRSRAERRDDEKRGWRLDVHVGAGSAGPTGTTSTSTALP
jgi:hypothetical protein